MDCRKSLVLALSLAGAAGCASQNVVQMEHAQPPPGAVVEKAKEPPRHQPKSPETPVTLGNWFAAEGANKPQGSAEQEQLYDKARREFQQALDIDAGCLSAYQALGQLYTSMSDYEGAVKWYRKGLEKLPREGSLWLNLGMCHARHKDWNPAVEALRRATECDPENKQYWNMLGSCLARCGRTEEALAAFGKGGGEAWAHYRLAFMLHHMNQDAEARQHLLMALRSAPTLEPAQRLLAQLEQPEPADAGPKQAGYEVPPMTATPLP
jgi:tetratricopeptide (TPR) repeat protein